MKERPILFCGEMIKAILAGRKTQTRRIIKEASRGWLVSRDAASPSGYSLVHDLGAYDDVHLKCKYGQPGDRLWVREAYSIQLTGREANYRVRYKADGAFKHAPMESVAKLSMWQAVGPHSPIHMPRWASRITLEITAVKVQRVQDITPDDCRAEGQSSENNDVGVRYGFGQLWNQINGNWNENPWVWAIEFKVIQPKET